MHRQAHRIELAQLRSLETRDIGACQFSRLTSTLGCQEEIDPRPVARFLQRIINQFSHLSEFARTDFLTCLIAFSKKCQLQTTLSIVQP